MACRNNSLGITGEHNIHYRIYLGENVRMFKFLVQISSELIGMVKLHVPVKSLEQCPPRFATYAGGVVLLCPLCFRSTRSDS